MRLLGHDRLRIVADHGALLGVVAPRRAEAVVVELLGTRLREGLVVPHAVLPRALADTLVRPSGAVGVAEGTAVDGHADDEFVRLDTGAEVHLDGTVDTVAVRVVVVQGSLVAGDLVPRTGKLNISACLQQITHVVGHEVPEVEDLVHLLDLQDADLLGTARGGNGELVLAFGAALATSQIDEGVAELTKEIDIALSVGGGLRVLVIDLRVRNRCWSGSSRQV